MKVTARATRSGDWWAVDIPELPGVFTQARRLDQVAAMVADAIAVMQDVAADTVEVEVDPVVDHASLVAEALDAKAQAEAAQEKASALVREDVQALMVEERLTVRDAGTILGISPQRVSQLQAGTPARSSTPRRSAHLTP